MSLTTGTLSLPAGRVAPPTPAPAPAPKGKPQVSAKAIKVVIGLNATEVLEALQPVATSNAKTTLTIVVGGRQVTAAFQPKAIRKAVAVLAEHGPERVFVMIQGKLMGNNSLDEAGLVAQVKTLKPAPAETQEQSEQRAAA